MSEPLRPPNAAELMRRLGFRFPTLEPTASSRAPALRYTAAGVPGLAGGRRVLHLTNGDLAAEVLRQAGLPGAVAVTADVLHEGPAPAGLTPERWRKVRARHLAESGYGDYDSCLATLTRWDRTIEDHRAYDEIVLWFEHDLFDQLLLIRTLDGFAGRNLGPTELWLVCVADGLGGLAPERMAGLLDRRQRVNEGQKLLARDAWRSFCSPDPTRLEALLRGDTSPLPFLAGALRRHLEEFPSTLDGLARTERQVLRALADQAGGAETFADLFRATQGMEERVYRGDSSFLRVLRELAAPPWPLVRLEPAPNGSPLPQRIVLTATGRNVLDGRDDWVRIRGDGWERWLGGVHLKGPEVAWRWYEAGRRLVPGRPALEA